MTALDPVPEWLPEQRCTGLSVIGVVAASAVTLAVFSDGSEPLKNHL